MQRDLVGRQRGLGGVFYGQEAEGSGRLGLLPSTFCKAERQ
ncbi:hypothetical protein [Deinococcus aetherius]|nr:hypothetical protein [Deinococcus aetherius]